MAKRVGRQEETRGNSFRRLRVSLMTGLAELTSFGHPTKRITSPYTDVAGALRSDWIRIGRDMSKVLVRKRNG